MNTQNSLKQVATATMVGTAIEYFDNYIYAMAAVLVFNHQSSMPQIHFQGRLPPFPL